MFSKYLPKRVAIAKRAPAEEDATETELAKLDSLLAKMDEEDDEEEGAPVAKKKAPMMDEEEDDDLDDLEAMLDDDEDEDLPPRKKMKKAADDEREPLTKREIELTKRLETLEKRERQRTLLTKAVSLVGEAPVAAEDVVKVLSVVTAAPDALAAFSSIMKKFSALAEGSGIFTTIGSSDDDGQAATTELTKAAVALRKSNPKLSTQQAIAKALEQNPELYDAYLGGDVSDADIDAAVGVDLADEED